MHMEYSWKYKMPEGFVDLVIGADGSLTGYGGGLANIESLLAHEGVDVVGGLCVAGVGKF